MSSKRNPNINFEASQLNYYQGHLERILEKTY